MPSATARDFQRVCRKLGGQPEATRHGYTLTGERLQSQSTAGAKSDHLSFLRSFDNWEFRLRNSRVIASRDWVE